MLASFPRRKVAEKARLKLVAHASATLYRVGAWLFSYPRSFAQLYWHATSLQTNSSNFSEAAQSALSSLPELRFSVSVLCPRSPIRNAARVRRLQSQDAPDKHPAISNWGPLRPRSACGERSLGPSGAAVRRDDGLRDTRGDRVIGGSGSGTGAHQASSAAAGGGRGCTRSRDEARWTWHPWRPRWRNGREAAGAS